MKSRALTTYPKRRANRKQQTPTIPPKRRPEPKNVADSARVVQRLHQFFTTSPELTSLLKGKIRRIKVEPHCRESRSIFWAQKFPTTTCKIRLTGNWIAQAGFTEHERIQVIPMKRMLIIIPE